MARRRVQMSMTDRGVRPVARAQARGHGGHASYAVSVAYMGSVLDYHPHGVPREFALTPRYMSSKSRYPDDVTEKAWQLLKDYMTPSQYTAFMAEKTIELENEAGMHRLLINKGGAFTILEGLRGEGVIAIQGTIRETQYPLGDEIAAFIDWFRIKTVELVESWGCGTFSIQKGPEETPRADFHRRQIAELHGLTGSPRETETLEEGRTLRAHMEAEGYNPDLIVAHPEMAACAQAHRAAEHAEAVGVALQPTVVGIVTRVLEGGRAEVLLQGGPRRGVTAQFQLAEGYMVPEAGTIITTDMIATPDGSISPQSSLVRHLYEAGRSFEQIAEATGWCKTVMDKFRRLMEGR